MKNKTRSISYYIQDPGVLPDMIFSIYMFDLTENVILYLWPDP